MRAQSLAAAGLLLAALAAPALPAGDPPAVAGTAAPAAPLTPAERKKVEAWIRNLDHQEAEKRVAATESLRAFGPRALDLLREASTDRAEERRARARLLVTVLEAGLPTGEIRADDWLTLKGDMGRTSARGDPPAGGPGLAVRAERSLRTALSDGLDAPDAPVASAEGAVVVAAGNRVSAYGSKDLGQRWAAGIPGRVLSAPVVARGLVYVGTSRGLTAFRLEDGRESWTVGASYGVGAAPLVLGNTLYACLVDESVVALDPVTGATRWEHRCRAGSAAPVVAGGRVVVGTKGAEVIALDAATGKAAWTLPVDGMISFAPAAVGSSVIIGDGGRRLRCVDAETGRVLWTRSVKGRFLGDGPAADARAVVFALESMEVEAYDPATGARLWNRWMGTRHLSSPAMAGGLVIFGSRSRLVAVDARSGDDAWSLALDGPVSCPVVADGTLYVVAGQRVQAIR